MCVLETYFLVDSMLLFFLNKCVLFFIDISLHYLCTHNSLIDSEASMIGMSHTYLWTNIEIRVNQHRNKVELYYPKTNIELVTECHYYVIVITHLRSKQLPSQKNKNPYNLPNNGCSLTFLGRWSRK